MFEKLKMFLLRRISKIEIFEREHFIKNPPKQEEFEVAGNVYTIGPFGTVDDHTEAMIRHAYAKERPLKQAGDMPERFFEILRASKFVNCFKVFHDGRPIGFVNFKIYDNEALNFRELSIRYIYAKEEHRSLRLFRKMFQVIEELARENQCDAILFGFDTGLEFDRKDKVARFIGFEKVTPTFFREFALRADQPLDLSMNKRFFGIRSLVQMSRASGLGRISAIRKFIPALLTYNFNVWNGIRYHEEIGESYAMAYVSPDLEQMVNFANILLVDRPSASTFERLEAWSQANQCAYGVVDSAYVGKDLSHLADDFAQAGYRELGGMYRKYLTVRPSLQRQ